MTRSIRASDPRGDAQRGASLVVVLLALAVAGFVAWYAVDAYLQGSVAAVGDAEGAPLDETKRQRTIADMQALGRAIALMQADTGSLPATFAELEAGRYLARAPALDAWGNAFAYMAGADGFTLVSLGADGRAGPVPPRPWNGGAYDVDLVMRNGELTQAPRSR